MRFAGKIALIVAVMPTAALAADGVWRGRLAENPNNMVDCRNIDEQIEREHKVTVSGNSVVYTAPGGTTQRFTQKGPGVWGTTDELGMERLKYTFSPETGTFTIKENNIGCIWSGTLKRQS